MSFARRFVIVLIWHFVVVLGSVTLLGFLDRFSWTIELIAFFRVQYAILLAAVAAVALLVRSGHAALIAVALALVNVAVVAPSLAEAAPQFSGASTHVRVLVANLDFRSREYGRMAKLLEEADADVLVLTELTPTWALALDQALGSYGQRRLELRSRASGIGLYSRLPMQRSWIEHFPRAGGPPTAIAKIDVRGTPLTVVGTHVHRPIEGAIHAQHLQALAEAAPRLGTPLVICGDFNTPPWTTAFRKLSESAGLTHLYERSWPAHTWPTWNRILRLTLDNCLVRDAAVDEHRRADDVGSDHFPLVVDLEVPLTRVPEAGKQRRRSGRASVCHNRA